MLLKNTYDYIKKAEEALYSLSKQVNEFKNVSVHSGNLFKVRFSRLLGVIEDLKVTAERLEEGKTSYQDLDKILLLHETRTKPLVDKEKLDRARTEVSTVTQRLRTDLRAFYLFSKNFIDEFSGLISIILDLEKRDIDNTTRSKSYSFSTLYYKLENYNGTDEIVLNLINSCLKIFRSAEKHISEYANVKIKHLNKFEKNKTVWTMYERDGNIRFIGDRPSLRQNELAYVVNKLVEDVCIFLHNYISDPNIKRFKITHQMKLTPIPFEQIKIGNKTIEIRLNDEKRQQLKVGDEIDFSLDTDPSQKITVTVKDLSHFPTFKELFSAFTPKDYGSESVNEYENMHEYYSKEDERKYGALAIKFEIIN